MAEEREGRRRAREMAWREPILGAAGGLVLGGGGWPFVDSGVFAEAKLLSSSASSPVCCACVGMSGRCCEVCTSHGSQPPGACVIFALSRPRRRGMEGPVRSMSRMPTDLPDREMESASWVVTEDLPTPPFPERTCGMREH